MYSTSCRNNQNEELAALLALWKTLLCMHWSGLSLCRYSFLNKVSKISSANFADILGLYIRFTSNASRYNLVQFYAVCRTQKLMGVGRIGVASLNQSDAQVCGTYLWSPLPCLHTTVWQNLIFHLHSSRVRSVISPLVVSLKLDVSIALNTGEFI